MTVGGLDAKTASPEFLLIDAVGRLSPAASGLRRFHDIKGGFGAGGLGALPGPAVEAEFLAGQADGPDHVVHEVRALTDELGDQLRGIDGLSADLAEGDAPLE
jgi:hypothetical protein